MLKKVTSAELARGLTVDRAARIVDHMERTGVVGPVLNAKGEREIFLEGSN